METKHTPGPWEFDGDGFDSLAAEDSGTDGYEIYSVDKNGQVLESVAYASIQLDDDIALANCRLIASAPELLEALEYIDGVMGVHEFGDDEIVHLWCNGKRLKEIRVTIAKAKAGAA